MFFTVKKMGWTSGSRAVSDFPRAHWDETEFNYNILTDFKNATLELQLNIHFHKRKQRDIFYCVLKTYHLLVSHEKLFTRKYISNVKNQNFVTQGLPISLDKMLS